ncbi:MAG: LPS export ABC transporter periplasmic protein LptC [Alphaproteobacteria bacterium]|nr:LPS export ABC transporter periplasmic protein LptC [Alphaproteobacteria bacterium]
MAHATSFDPVPPAGRAAGNRNGRLVVVGVDRSTQFGKARRHTFVVKSMRRLLPLLTLGSMLAYVGSALLSADFGTDAGLRAIARILPENLTMNNPYYEGFTDDGGSYVVRAKTAQQDLAKPDLIELNAITGVLTDAKKSKTNLTATKGSYNSKSGVLNLFGGIDVASEDGLTAKLTTAVVRTKQSVIVSSDPVQVNMQGGQVNSDSLRIQQKEKIITFFKNVHTKLTPEKPGADGANGATQPAKARPVGQAAMLGASDAPIDIDSARLQIDRNKGLAVFTGDVKAVQVDQTLLTDTLEVKFEPKTDSSAAAAVSGNAKPAAGALPDSSKIELITAPRPVIMTRGELEQMTGLSAVFDAKKQTALIKGSVVMSSGPDRKALAEEAEINSQSDTILLTGSVVVRQGENELRGERLFVDRAKGTSQMTSVKDAAGKGGRVFAKLKREAGGAASPKADAKVADVAHNDAGKPASALTSSLSATAFKGDPKAPIDIEADRLDVDDSKKAAVFSGTVLVEQGPMSLSAASLTAFYSGEANLVGTEPAPKPAPGTAAADPASGSGTELTRIKANGGVFVTSKVNGQNAKGDWADIDMKANTVLLGGDVVLNQGKNVVQASLLKIDLTTGNAVVEASPEELAGRGWASTTVPNIESAIKGKRGKNRKKDKKDKKGMQIDNSPPLKILRGNRPSAVFYPTQLGSAKKKAEPAAPSGAAAPPKAETGAQRPAASSSWEATTQDVPVN